MIRTKTFFGMAIAASLFLHGAVGGILILCADPSPVSDRGDRGAVLWVESGAKIPPLLPTGSPPPRRKPSEGPVLSRAEGSPVEKREIEKPADLSPDLPEIPLRPSSIADLPATPTMESESRDAPLAVPPPPGEAPTEKRRNALDDFLRDVQEAIEKSKVYPWRARVDRLEGTVTVAFSLRKDGEPERIRVNRSSGHSLLDRSALEAIRNRARFPRIPEALGTTQMDLTVPMVYRMEEP